MRKIISCLLCTMMLMIGASPLTAFAQDEVSADSVRFDAKLYVFNNKHGYPIDSSKPLNASLDNCRMGSLTLGGSFTEEDPRDGVPSYLVDDNAFITLNYEYKGFEPDSSEPDWYQASDFDNKVNGVEYDGKIGNGAVILQTSFDRKRWVTSGYKLNVTSDTAFENGSGLNDMQLINGCFYRVIAAYRTEKIGDKKYNIDLDNLDVESGLNAITRSTTFCEYAEVYEFYAGYKPMEEDNSGSKYYYDSAKCNVKTKKNDYVGDEAVAKNDPHYGWSMGSFCLSGYTDKADEDGVYLKTVGNKIRLSYQLDQDITKLNDKPELSVAEDKKGCDGEFQVKPHNMGHGELLIKYTDSEGKSTITQYSDFLEAVNSPGADTTIQLFEEGDYEVHLDYAVTNKLAPISGLSNDLSLSKDVGLTTYYRTSFSFKIRNGNCMVYIFDSQTGSELNNGDVTENGFKIDTAKSSYPKLSVKKEILNDTASGLVEDTRFNRAVSDGESFTEEGIYTVTAYNRYDKSLTPSVKTIYVGTNNLLTAYTKNLSAEKPYTIEQLNDLVEDGYNIDKEGEISKPKESLSSGSDAQQEGEKKFPVFVIPVGVVVIAAAAIAIKFKMG